MTDPPPAPDDSTGPERRSWETQIEALLERSRRQTQPDESGPPPVWLPQAVQLLGGLVHASVVAHTEQATTTVRAQLNEERRRRTQAHDELAHLRDTIRTYLAEIVASGAGIDRHDANEALRGWGIDTLPARFTVTLTATIAATLVADDAEDAATQAQRLLDELGREDADEVVTVIELHTDEVAEHDELPDPVALG